MLGFVRFNLYLYLDSKNILSVHLVIVTEMDRGTLKKNNRKQKYIFLISCLSVCRYVWSHFFLKVLNRYT